MTELADLPTPALLLDLDVLEANLRRMAERARRLGVGLRPHVKTHKCPEVARRQQDAGATGLTVATLEEARTFAAAGFDDLTWAFPVILNRMKEAREIAERATLRLVVDSPEAIDALETEAFPFHTFLKVDCGYHRAGVDPASGHALELARRLDASERLLFDGLLSHSGHAYEGREEAPRAAEEERRVMAGFAERLRGEGIEVPVVSVGSTPGTSAVEDLTGVTEVRPGNYAFYDLMQVRLGACEVADCALTVLASVVSSQPGAGRSVVDAGALALSKDRLEDPDGVTFGALFEHPGSRRLHPELHLRSLSQEHGIVTGALPVGSRVRILPVHSCLTAACFDGYAVVRGEEVVERWRVHRER